jgi:hypothetical protein
MRSKSWSVRGPEPLDVVEQGSIGDIADTRVPEVEGVEGVAVADGVLPVPELIADADLCGQRGDEPLPVSETRT